MTPYERDEISRLKADAKHFRELAAMKRKQLGALKALPVGHKDPIAEIKANDQLREYVRDAQNCDSKIKRIRAVAAEVEIFRKRIVGTLRGSE